MRNRVPVLAKSGHVDASVVVEVLGEPGSAAADDEQARVGGEVAHDVGPVAGLSVPVEVAHGARGYFRAALRARS